MDCNRNEALRAQEIAGTFWTVCNRCNRHFEYEKIFVNQNLFCHRCKQPFLAIEVAAPVVNTQSSPLLPFGPVSHKQQDMPHFSSVPKRTSEASSCRGLKRRNGGLLKVEGALVSAPSVVSRSVKKLSRTEIRAILQQNAKAELINFISLR